MPSAPDPPIPPPPPPPPPRLPPLPASALSFRTPARQDLTWVADRVILKRWLLVFVAMWLGGAALWILGAMNHVGAMEGFGMFAFVAAVAPYVVSLVYAYRVQDKLNKAGLYKHGAWQIIVGGLLLNPFFLGFLIPTSVLMTANRIRRTLPSSGS